MFLYIFISFKYKEKKIKPKSNDGVGRWGKKMKTKKRKEVFAEQSGLDNCSDDKRFIDMYIQSHVSTLYETSI